MTETLMPRLALVGDRSPAVAAHTRIPLLIDALARRDRIPLDAYWIGSEDVAATDMAAFDAIWIIPGSPYRSEAGAVAAARTARERGIPFLGTCGGFQHAVLEFGRNVCGLTDATHAEYEGGTGADALITPLTCSLVGHEGAITLTPGSLAERILGVERTVERYHCSYGPNRAYLATLTGHGLRFTGHDDDGDARVLELPGHPFFLATLFQPELAGDGTRPHPVIRAFATAAARHAAASAADEFGQPRVEVRTGLA